MIGIGITIAGGGVNSLFDPASLGSLELWCQFNTGITITGSGVSQWDDQSGNGNHLKQATDTRRPSEEGDGSILFDGVDNLLKADAFTLVQPETVYILFKSVTWTVNRRIYDGDNFFQGTFFQSASTPELKIRVALTSSVNSDMPVGEYHVAAVVFNGASSVLQIDNLTPLTADVGAGDMAGFLLGARGDTSEPSNIQVKEVLIYSVAHDAATRKKVIDYLLLI